MYRLRRPARAEIERFLEREGRREPSCDVPGIAERAAASDVTRIGPYVVGRVEARLGAGRDTFERGAAALRSWRMFPAPIEVCWPDAPIEAGTVAAVLGRPLGTWSLNALRIRTVIDERDDRHARFGFVYGTLPDHAVVGEERFEVAWSANDDEARYTLVSCARQGSLAARLAAPLSRRLQARFRAASARAMIEACREPSERP